MYSPSHKPRQSFLRFYLIFIYPPSCSSSPLYTNVKMSIPTCNLSERTWVKEHRAQTRINCPQITKKDGKERETAAKWKINVNLILWHDVTWHGNNNRDKCWCCSTALSQTQRERREGERGESTVRTHTHATQRNVT